MTPIACPQCGDPAAFSKKREAYYCAECELAFAGAAAEGGAAHAATPADPIGRASSPLKLFLSYGRDDHVAEVKALLQALRQRGHEVWFDEEQLGTGLDWEQRIEKGLQWCDRVVLTMTPHSVRRPDGYCLNEIAKALELRKLIIPVLLVEVPQGAPTSICRIQYLDWRDAVPAAEKADRFLRRLARLCEAIEEDKLDFEGGQQRLIRHLQPLNFDGDLQRHVASFKGRVQLEARLRQWLADPQGSQVLWLTAAPGLGKSAVAATLSHRWAEVAAVHFCVAGQQDKANPARAVLSIAYQLSQRQHMNLYASRLSNLELEREAHKDARTLFDTLLVGPLAKNFPEPPEPLLVILDGLDEATQPEGENPLAEIIAADWGRLPPWLRLMVSSRPEAELVTWLSGTQRIDIRSDDAEQQADLAAFLRERMAAIGRPPGEETLSRILSRSEGAFHYAVLLIEEVRQGRCDPDNPVDLPAGLNPFYAQTFRRRFTDITAYRSQTRPLLELILAAPEPVPLAVLAGATKREAQDVRQDLSALGSMLAIEPGQGEADADWDTVRLSHASLRSWLTGLDATRQPLAGAYAAKVDTKGLAAEVLRLWEASNDPSKDVQDPDTERKGFVARTLWTLLKSKGNRDEMEGLAYDLSRYWADRKLALAIEPGEWIAEAGWREYGAQPADADLSAFVGLILDHLGGLNLRLGQSTDALSAYRRSLSIFSNLSELHPDNDGLWGRLAHIYTSLGSVLERQGDLDGALENFREALSIAQRRAVQDPEDAGWQRYLCIGSNRIGAVLQAQGHVKAALCEFRNMLTSAQRLTANDPENLHWWGYLSTSHLKMGALLRTLGDLEGSLLEFRTGQVITDRLTNQCPTSDWWQESLVQTHRGIGLTLLAADSLPEAMAELLKSETIAERLAAQDPANVDWQSDLAASYNSIGGVLESQGNLAGALEAFRKYLTIAERLATQDPDNAGWQSDLAFSLYRTGEIHAQLEEYADAASLWRRELEVRATMAARSEDPSEADDDLSNCHNQIGSALEAMGDFDGAREAFSEYLRLGMNVLARDPEDTTKQRNVAVGEASVARSELALGNLEQAKALQSRAADTFQALRDADDVGSQMDWAAALALGAEIEQAAGDTQALTAMQGELATLDLGNEEPVGRFRKRFMPLIKQHLMARLERPS